ncbi:MAG: LysM peptidoglycan-binding domain-containing protein [Candidatus Parabeggiatoa sp.]|nr:LysM peptidoglycan-binding domain-containing protein [Candidatus Parabeggiatoa sp.]
MNTDILTKELINFIEKLRFAGYNIGETQYIAAQDLILILAAQGKLPTEQTELRQFLAPILCHSPKEQAEFETHFNQWVRQFSQTKIETESGPPSDLESELRTIKKGNTLWKWVFIIFVIVFLSSILVYCSDIAIAQPIQPNKDEIAKPIKPDSHELVQPKSILPSTETTSEKNYHTVQAGETLYGIAKKYDQNYQKIAAWNNIDNPDSISIGQRLLVSPRNEKSSADEIPSVSSSLLVSPPNEKSSPDEILAVSPSLLVSPPNEKSSADEIQAVTPSLLVSPSNEKSSPDKILPVTPSLWDILPSLQVLFTLLSPLLVLLLWQLWWRYRAQLFLARQSTTTLPDIRQLFLKPTEDKFFQSVSLARTAQQLRKHISMPANVLDIAAAIEKTTQSGGWFTPITGTIKTRPEYLALIDRTTFNDHQTQFINSLINQLVADEVSVTRYYFDSVPRRCYPEQSQQAPLTLTELAQHYPEHRLLVFSDGNGLINPITCQVVNWIEQFSVWTQRALFTLETPEEWGYREQLLDEANFLILPANEAGFKGLVERINTSTWQPYPRPSDSDSNPFPEYLQERPRRWLEHHAPDTPVLTALLKQVRNFIGNEGYSWFSACAIYPELRWQLTLYLGEQLKSLTEERLAKLARLPWFRYGYMPDWLRMPLIKDLSLPQERKIRTALYNRLLETSDKPLSDFCLEIAKTQQNTLSAFAQRLLPKWAKQAQKNSPLHEHIFMTFMGDKLAVKIPKILRHLFAQSPEPTVPLSALNRTFIADKLAVKIPEILRNLFAQSPEPTALKKLSAKLAVKIPKIWRNLFAQSSKLYPPKKLSALNPLGYLLAVKIPKILRNLFTQSSKPYPPKKLSALNPLDYFRLLWGVLVMPQQLINYRKKFGERDDRRVGQWLVSTLICLPLLMPSLALGLEWLPHSNNAWSPETYLWTSVELVGCWLLLGYLDDEWVGGVAFVVASGVASDVVIGVPNLGVLLVAFVMALLVPFGVASGVASEVVSIFVGIVVGGMMIVVTLGLAGGLAVVVVVIVASSVAGSVAFSVEESLQTGTPSWLARFAFLLLIAAHLFLIVYCFLGGWRLFV